jgi:hypothetical protein
MTSARPWAGSGRTARIVLEATIASCLRGAASNGVAAEEWDQLELALDRFICQRKPDYGRGTAMARAPKRTPTAPGSSINRLYPCPGADALSPKIQLRWKVAARPLCSPVLLC